MDKISLLEKEIERVESEIRDLRGTRSLLFEKVVEREERLKDLKEELHDLERDCKGIEITDHAIVRILDRYFQIDAKELVREFIEKYGIEEKIRQVGGNGKFRISHGGVSFTFVVKNYHIITAFPNE